MSGQALSAIAVQAIALATDFGYGPYVGQMRLRLQSLATACPVIDLIHDLPVFRPDLSAYLLPALLRDLPPGVLYVCVVDPGVGSSREVLLLEADGSWLIGPDNGLLALVARRAQQAQVHRLGWRPAWMSDSFHGRDLFVPLAARIRRGEDVAPVSIGLNRIEGAAWPAERAEIIYRDPYGNLMTGLSASQLSREAEIRIGTNRLAFARTFCEVPVGTGFWYENAFGLVELAVNQGRASDLLNAFVGEAVEVAET